VSDFELQVRPEEKKFIKDLVRFTIASRLGVTADDPRPLESALLKQKLGAFVTLKIKGRLRGCIGHVVGDAPLAETIERMALAAAFEDPRFPPMTNEEFNDLEIEISILGPLERVEDPEAVEPGRHGLVVVRGARSGLLLPQVAVEWGWGRHEFLARTCAKAGLPSDAWTLPDPELFRFEAKVF
jgi:hypothetical protein